jgi:hypothetical protein
MATSLRPRSASRTGRGLVAVAFAALALSTPRGAAAQKPKPAPAARPAAKPGARPATPAAAAAAKPGERATGEANLVQTAAEGNPDAPVLTQKEDKEGVKTYNFSAVEVEGRLRSPQLLYFLRRVRAEFSAGDLGHRSFLRELSETQREATFR